jgi:hypothetical protein
LFHETAGKERIVGFPNVQNKWPEPAWIAALPEIEHGPARVRHFLNLAAAYHGESASLADLSLALGYSKPYLNVARQRGRVSPELAVKIEATLGRDRFPRELFNDIFAVAEQ